MNYEESMTDRKLYWAYYSQMDTQKDNSPTILLPKHVCRSIFIKFGEEQKQQ